MLNKRQSDIIDQKRDVNGRLNIFDSDDIRREYFTNKMRIRNKKEFVEYVGIVRRKMQNKIKNIEMKNNGQDYQFFQEHQMTSSNLVQVAPRKHRNHYKLYQAFNKNQQYHKNIQISQPRLYNSLQNLNLQPNNKKLKLLKEPQTIKKTNASKGLIRYDIGTKNKKYHESTVLNRQKNRQNSLPSVGNRKKNQTMLKSARYNQIKTQQNAEQSSQNNKGSTLSGQEMGNFFFKIPKNREIRTTQEFIPLLTHLKSFNKIFVMLAQQLALCLLRIGIYHELFPGDILYKNGQDKNSFYIVLSGVVALINGSIKMKKLIYTGQTMGQQMAFGNNEEKNLLETAKSITKAYILEIKVKDYIQIRGQAKRYGFSSQFQEFQDQLRDALTIKNIYRNACLINQHTQFQS